MNYLIDHVLGKYGLNKESHVFIRDRTRAIRQDIILQNYKGIETVDILEKCARFHIMALHEMCEYPEREFNPKMEREQISGVLSSLSELYDYLRKRNEPQTNEAEFRAYMILFHLFDVSQWRRMEQKLPIEVFSDSKIQVAIELSSYAQHDDAMKSKQVGRNITYIGLQNYFYEFFRTIFSPSVDYLSSCLLHVNFKSVRRSALKAMNIAYRKQYPFPVLDLIKSLGFDDIEEAINFLGAFGLEVMQNVSAGNWNVIFSREEYIIFL